MIIIDGILVNEAIFKEQFVCDLSKCKGGCCVEGDTGAPLTDQEAKNLQSAYEKVKKILPTAHQEKIENEGFYAFDRRFGKVTPTLDSGICTYAFYDKDGSVKCGLEKLQREGKSSIPKPISCHLFPIRVRETGGFISLNYEPRPGLCDPACSLGKSLKVPVYRFLKDSIIKRFGETFYSSMEKRGQRYLETGKL